MEIGGSTYLYAMAGVAMAFVGFTSIVVSIRQTLGADLSKFQLLLMRILIEHGFVVVGFAFLPSLLAMFDISHLVVWRISSFLAAIFIFFWMGYYVWRRYPAARSKAQPRFAFANYTVAMVAVLALFCNAIGYPFKPQAGVYAAGISWVLFQAADIFILSFRAFLKPREDVPQ